MTTKPYQITLKLHGKNYEVLIDVNRPEDEEGYHYNLELRTQERISGNEFQILRKYLEEEGYIEEAANHK